MGEAAKPNICIGLFAAIFFVQRQQKSISAATPAMRSRGNFFSILGCYLRDVLCIFESDWNLAKLSKYMKLFKL